jgi:hypothetical protein
MLARELRQAVPYVTGIDRDAASIELARRQDEDGRHGLGAGAHTRRRGAT